MEAPSQQKLRPEAVDIITQEKIVQVNYKETRLLQTVISSIAIFLALAYNCFAVTISRFVIAEGIVDNEGFFANKRVMKAYTAYLCFNCAAQVTLACSLLFSTCRLVKDMQYFFKEKFKSQTRSLLCVTMTTLLCQILIVVSDVAVTTTQVTGQAWQGDSFDGIVVPCYIAFVPALVFNTLHFVNIRQRGKDHTVREKGQIVAH